MSTCKFCGKDAGFLRSAHKECLSTFERGRSEIASLLSASTRGKLDPSIADKDIKIIAHSSYIDEQTLKQTALECLEHAIDLALDDALLSEEEESALDDFIKRYDLKKAKLNTNESYLRLVKAGVLRDLLEGKIPNRVVLDGQLPINFQKSEQIIWIFQDVEYLQPRTRTTYEGRSSGVSFRVMKGVYYRVGQFKGNPIQTTQIVTVDKGILVATNKNLYFVGGAKSLRVPFNKIVTFQPYSDAIAISRDRVIKQDIFKTGDGWFTYNLISSVASAGT